VIRLAGVSDLSAVTELVERYWQFEQINGFDGVRIAALLGDFFHSPDRGQIWIADVDGRAVGYLLVGYLFSVEHGGLMAELDEFFVTPEKRSLKIGTALLDAATSAMAQQGIKHAQLQLGNSNAQAQRFYQLHGFKPLSDYQLLCKSLQP
jgi:GNAT superfamily N-acetyltransferase